MSQPGDQEDFYRGDLSGIVYNIDDGGFVGVKLMDGRHLPQARLVTTAEGLLKIDPSGLPVLPDPRSRPTPAEPEPDALNQPARFELEPGHEDIADAEVVVEGDFGDPEDWDPFRGSDGA